MLNAGKEFLVGDPDIWHHGSVLFKVRIEHTSPKGQGKNHNHGGELVYRKSNWFFLTSIVCIGIACNFLAAHATHGAPAIIITETGFNFGELSETTPLSHNFIVKNGGTATLNIKDVQPS